MMRIFWIGVFGLAVLSSCTTRDQIKEIIKKNPDIITDVIKENPVEIFEALAEAQRGAQEGMAKKRQEEEEKAFEESFKNPLKPEIGDDEIVRGKKDAPIVLVEYSDFLCGYCAKAYETVMSLLEKHKDNIQFVYKHFPLQGPLAELSSRYYEAIRLQSEDKAVQFHDEMYQNQQSLRRKQEAYLESLAKKLKVNMTKLKSDLQSEAVSQAIEDDSEEAKEFGFGGTPGFLVNGIPVRGAYPESHFNDIIERLKKEGKISI